MAFAYADRGSALPSNLQSASRRGSFTRLPGSLLLRPVKLLAPCADLTGNFPSHRDFYFQASIESVALLDAGYNYDSHWNALSMGLSPIGLTSSLAARPRKLMKITWRYDGSGLGRRGRPLIGEFEAVFLSDPERA